jgi:O-acetylserine/cysteine efflux transporter
MTPRDFLALVSVCLVWGLNFAIAKFSVTGAPGWVPGFEGAPPIFFAFLRFFLLSVLLLPWLRPRPIDLKAIFWIAMTMGAAQYVLIFMGLQWATPSGMAIALQTGVPFATLLSVVFLKERLGWPRILGIIVTMVGAAIVVARPDELDLTYGLLIGIGAAFAGSLGMILVKQAPLDSIRLQAWIGLFSWPPLLALSLLTERDQVSSSLAGGWPFLLALIFTVAIVNIYGHGVFYNLLKKYDASLIAPLTLMAPMFGVISGIWLMDDPAGWRLWLGGALTLVGAGIIAARRNKALPTAGLAREKSL